MNTAYRNIIYIFYIMKTFTETCNDEKMRVFPVILKFLDVFIVIVCVVTMVDANPRVS